MSYGNEIPIFWLGQTTQDWKRYDRDGFDLWFMKGRALEALDYHAVNPANLPIYERLNLKPLRIRSNDPLGATSDSCSNFSTPPAEFAAAADRLAAALEARESDATPFVEEYTEQGLQHLEQEWDRRSMKDEDWDTLSLEFRRIAQVARKIAEEGIPLITLDMGGDGWAADPEGKEDF